MTTRSGQRQSIGTGVAAGAVVGAVDEGVSAGASVEGTEGPGVTLNDGDDAPTPSKVEASAAT
jgi:hypothetical protein